jgi:hypothetical protein
VSNFRTIWVAALAAPLLVLIADAAVAQTATAADQSGKILAGLRPPHEHHKLAHGKTGPAKSQHDAATKVARKPTKRRSVVAASSTAEVPRRAAKNLNSHVANSHTVNSRIANSHVTNSPITWPSAEPAAAEETSASQTALQFATEDTASNAVHATTTVTATTAKAKPAATDERKDSGDMRPTASKLVQTERFEAPAASQIFSQAPSEMPGQKPSQIPSQAASPTSNQAPIAAPARQEMTPANRASSSASILVTLAGAITAGLVGWLMFGFGSSRTIRVSREPTVPIRYLPFVPLR